MIKARINVKLKKDVLDPQGKALHHSLANMGFDNINRIRQGKIFDLEIDENDPEVAKKQLIFICENLLANLVIEDYDILLV